MRKLVYLLPVHNEETVLEGNVRRLTSYLERLPGSEVMLIENGSLDGSWAAARALAAAATGDVPVHAFREATAGIGHAYHRGLTETLKRFGPSDTRWAVLTAADLPFGFSDLEAALVDLERSSGRVMMGSKAHPASELAVAVTPTRKAMTSIYRFARRAVVGMRVGDSQGSVFLRLDLAQELLPKIDARGFFYSTELCYFAERAGESILELPIVCEAPQRPSTVRPLRDGLGMARDLWRLRGRR